MMCYHMMDVRARQDDSMRMNVCDPRMRMQNGTHNKG